MSTSDVGPPLVVELSRLLELRAAYLKCGEPVQAVIGDTDLMVIAFLSSELGVGELAVDSPAVLEAMRSAKLADYVRARAGQPFELRALGDEVRPGPATSATARVTAVGLDARETRGHDVARSRTAAIAFLYGLRGPVDMGRLGSAAALVEGRAVLMSMAGLGVALWNCSVAVVVAETLGERTRQAAGSLCALVRDRSLDPLLLAETCLELRTRRSHADEEFARLRARVAELEDAVWVLKNSLLKQQRALALANDARTSRQRPDGSLRPDRPDR